MGRSFRMGIVRALLKIFAVYPIAFYFIGLIVSICIIFGPLIKNWLRYTG